MIKISIFIFFLIGTLGFWKSPKNKTPVLHRLPQDTDYRKSSGTLQMEQWNRNLEAKETIGWYQSIPHESRANLAPPISSSSKHPSMLRVPEEFLHHQPVYRLACTMGDSSVACHITRISNVQIQAYVNKISFYLDQKDYSKKLRLIRTYRNKLANPFRVHSHRSGTLQCVMTHVNTHCVKVTYAFEWVASGHERQHFL